MEKTLISHNFPDKVTLVFKKNVRWEESRKLPDGEYVYEDQDSAFIALDQKSLETGKNWARYNYSNDKTKDPEVITYTNGHFKLELSKAAESSYSQGKRSFWTLIATAPDGKVFDIGINSESLISTIFETNVINGKLEGSYYLGRTQGQQSITQKDGVYYQEYLKIESIRSKKLTKSYKLGDIIVNNNESYRYNGKFHCYINVTTPYNDDDKDKYYSRPFYISLSVNDNLKKSIHLYSRNTSYSNNSGNFDDYISDIYFNKRGGRIVGHEDITINNKSSLLTLAYNKNNLKETEDHYRGKYYWHGYLENYLAIKGIKTMKEALEELKKLDIYKYYKE